MKNQKKKMLISILATLSVILVLVIGGILAYLTDVDEKDNKFIIGDVDIVLHEDNWNPTEDTDNDGEPDAVIVGYGDVVAKNPQIENIGKNSSCVYLKVTVPLGSYEDGVNTVSNVPIFEYTIDSENWTELEEARSTDETGKNNIYVYYYNDVLPVAKGENQSITPALFENIKLKDEITGDSVDSNIMNVNIKAYAIQATGLPTGTDVETTQWALEFIADAETNPQIAQTTDLSKISLEDCTISQETMNLYVTRSNVIEILKPAGELLDIEPVTYTSSNPSIATVDKNGKVTGVAPGTAIITIQGKITGKILQLEINVDISPLYGLIPGLSSDVGENGEAFANANLYSADYAAYKAFNLNLSGIDKTAWASYVLENNYGFVGYKFNQPTLVNMFYVNTLKPDNNTGACMNEFVLQGSNDNTNWVDLTDLILHSPNTEKYYPVTKNQGEYLYYRLYGKSAGAYSLIAITELQLF